MEYKNKVVMVTGGGSGIGKATSIMFAKEGAKVVVCDINKNNALQTVDVIKKQNKGEAIAIELDVTESNQIKNALETIINEYNEINILVNVAGIVQLGKITNITDKEWDKVLKVNLKGTFLCSREVIPIMESQRSGCIINVTAAAAKTGGMNVGGNYVASKGGISSLTINMANQLAQFGIRVNAVSPGPIATPMLIKNEKYTEEKLNNIEKSTPLGMGKPKDIAHGILFLASEIRARYITGEILDVDGGLFMD